MSTAQKRRPRKPIEIAEEIAESLRLQGFDNTRISSELLSDHSSGEDRFPVYPRCSQCEAAVIQGMACHEHGCRNQPRSSSYDEDDDE